ncbi:MAG: hypothetical protein LBD48_08725 [Treponema sp.]|jgi:hypothetical protein|nr:hypothetical protein [Treponema sp.]
MKNVAMGLMVMLVLGLALVGCDNPTTTETGYFDVAPVKDLTLSKLIEEEKGAFFQGATRSLRFFDDGGFQVFNMGLFMNIQNQNTFGSRYIVDGDTIKIYRTADTDDALPFYTLTYTLAQHTLEITAKTNGAGNAPNNTQIPLGEYSYGKLPFYRP